MGGEGEALSASPLTDCCFHCVHYHISFKITPKMYLILYIIKGHIHAWQELSRIKDTYPELKDISGVIYKRSLAVVGRSIYMYAHLGKAKSML